MSADAQGSPEIAQPIRVAIIGGGLAGLAAALALAESQMQRKSNGKRLAIELFESRRMLGGRATSYRDSETGELIDNCQHVSLGCCTNFDDFCRRTGIGDCFRTIETLRFLGPDGRVYKLRGSAWLSAPLHLAPSLFGLSYLSISERVSAAWALARLAWMRPSNCSDGETIGDWLRRYRQSERSIALFWSPIIVSALAVEIEQPSVAAARKVFVDGLLRHAHAYHVRVPSVPLIQLYDEYIARRLVECGVQIRLGEAIGRVVEDNGRIQGLELAGGRIEPFDCVVVAAPGYRANELFTGACRERLPLLPRLDEFTPSPITSVHLWFDREIFEGDHLVLPGRVSQWLFNHDARSNVRSNTNSHYYQVVISGSRELLSWPRDDIIGRVGEELRTISVDARDAELVAAKVITEHRAVFSPSPGIDRFRPLQTTPIPNLFLAGDWTATGWPATMEGAVRSGYLAAEAVLEWLGSKESILVPDLPAAPLSRWLFGIH